MAPAVLPQYRMQPHLLSAPGAVSHGDFVLCGGSTLLRLGVVTHISARTAAVSIFGEVARTAHAAHTVGATARVRGLASAPRDA